MLARMALSLVATCGLGLEEILEGEVCELGISGIAREKGAVAFRGGWEDCWRANWRLRTANRVLVELGSWDAADGEALAAGARALAGGTAPRGAGPLDAGRLLHPERSFAVRASAAASAVRDPQWAALKVKDGLVDGQRDRWGRRASVDRGDPDLHLRLRLHRDRATLLLDTSGEPLDHRGYRAVSAAAPVREQLAAATALAAGWDGRGPVVDPMCGSGTLLVEAAWMALGRPPGALREGWAFERLPGFDAAAFARVRAEPLPAPARGLALHGNDRSAEALRAARANLERAGVLDLATSDAGGGRGPGGAGGRARAGDRQPALGRAPRRGGRAVEGVGRPPQAPFHRLAGRGARRRRRPGQGHRLEAPPAHPGDERAARGADPGLRPVLAQYARRRRSPPPPPWLAPWWKAPPVPPAARSCASSTFNRRPRSS